MRTLTPIVALAVCAAAPAHAQAPACPYNANMKLETRRSPLDSLTLDLGGATVKVCYGRPSLRGRTMIGGEAVPFGTVWRTGANETSKFIASAPVTVGSLEVPAGMYALYSVPGETVWEIIVNRSYEQWGRENTYTDEVKAQELGRVTVPVERTADPIETFTIRAEPQPDGSVHLVLEWEHTRVRIPVQVK